MRQLLHFESCERAAAMTVCRLMTSQRATLTRETCRESWCCVGVKEKRKIDKRWRREKEVGVAMTRYSYIPRPDSCEQ
jgi:hypothetical protein